MISKEVLTGLQKMLSNTYALAANTHMAHWNVTGRQLFELHEAFGEIYDQLYSEADLIAERIRSLGVKVEGGLEFFLKDSTISPIRKDAKEVAMVDQILSGLETIIEQGFSLRKLCGKVDDLENQDFVMAQIQNRQKNAWMLRSFLE